ncbi:MAG: phosphatase PAP2 family protein [Ramlibacter sp.]
MKAALAACLLLAALLAWQVVTGGVLVGQDLRLTSWLVSHRQGWLTQAMLAVSELHRTLGVLAATAAVAAWLLWRRRRRDALSLLVVPTGMLLNVGLKNVFQRIRPALDEPLVNLTTFSFPSGHAVASTVFYGALCAIALGHLRAPPRRGLAVAAAMAMVLLVCFSRVYLGAHYLTDVVAGVAVGLAWLLLARRALS